MYYLDTNALRSLSPVLSNCVINDLAFTSILSFIELFTQVKDERSFLRTKKIFSNIYKSGLLLEGLLPELMIAKAFNIKLNTDIVDIIGERIAILLNTESYAKFLEAFPNNAIDEETAIIYQYDKNSSRFPLGLSMRQEEFDMLKSKSPELLSIYSKEHRQLLLTFGIEFYRSIVFKHFNSYVNGCDIGDLQYDGSIDVYIITMINFIYSKLDSHNFAARNDYHDINHLLYLGSGNSRILVTDDKNLLENVNKYYPNIAITVADFKMKY